MDNIQDKRRKYSILPVYKRIDTCGGEFQSEAAYLYSTYDSSTFTNQICEAQPSNKDKVIILGSGPNRIGQGIEFDYCCCHACFSLSEEGIETIMINCNPETVSTDFDTSEKLYFEPLNLESVINIIEKEKKKGNLIGVIVQYGGQTPLKLANDLDVRDVKILGTIDLRTRETGSIFFGEIGLALNSVWITVGRCCCLVGGLGRCLRRVRDFGWGLLLVSSFCRICFGFRVRLHRRYYRCRRDGNVRIFLRLVLINAGRRLVHRVCSGR